MEESRPSFTCSKCKKIRPRLNHPNNRVCLRCQLFGVLLLKAFGSIVTTPDMIEFTVTMKEWYLNDA
jgi:hypothetical protein